MSFSRVFVANRGEIALRIARASRRLGLESVLGASEVDLEGPAARPADRVVCIGPAPPERSYLRHDTVVYAALGTGCDAIHPGYDAAVDVVRAALDGLQVEGVETNRELLASVLAHDDFARGAVTTRWLEEAVAA